MDGTEGMEGKYTFFFFCRLPTDLNFRLSDLQRGSYNQLSKEEEKELPGCLSFNDPKELLGKGITSLNRFARYSEKFRF